MKKIVLGIILLLSTGANASVDNVDEVLVCDQCNELHMEIIAQAYGIQNVTAGSRDVMVYSPSDGMFREFVVTPLSIDGFFGPSGNSSNAQMEPLRYNQGQAEYELKVAFEAIKSLRAELNSPRQELLVNFGANQVFGSAADALRNPEEAALSVQNFLNTISVFDRLRVEQQAALNRTSFGLTLQTRLAGIQANFEKGRRTFITSGFGDGSTWQVELELAFLDGKTNIRVKPTKVAYFNGGTVRIPISADGVRATEHALQFNHGLADLARLFRYYDSLSSVTSNQTRVNQGSTGGGGACFATCFTTTYSDGSTSQEYCVLDPDCNQ
jgi:hypothetical protein